MISCGPAMLSLRCLLSLHGKHNSMSRIFCLCFELNDESIMIQQTRLYRSDCEVIYAFGIKESNLGERFALGSAALS